MVIWRRENIHQHVNGTAPINDMVWSTTVKFGRDTKVIIKALKDKNITALKDSEIIELVQDYKIENNQRLFSSSPSLWGGLLDRAKSEKAKEGANKRGNSSRLTQ